MTTQRMLPLYEAKMIHHYDHRWATYDGGDVRDVTASERKDPVFEPLPRYWVRQELVKDRLSERWSAEWLLGFRDICRSTDERTVIFGSYPVAGVGHTSPIVLQASRTGAGTLYALAASFVVDYVARQKIGGTHLTYGYLTQLPFSPDIHWPWVKQDGEVWVHSRVVELAYTAYKMRAFAEDLGDDGEPFVWDRERRFWLRAELDAAFFHLYGVERDDVDYIMETFPIVRRKELAAHGSFRTKEAILRIHDAMAEAVSTGTEYQSVLSPPPGDGPRHPAQEEAS